MAVQHATTASRQRTVDTGAPLVSVVVMAYNEGASIREVLEEIVAVMDAAGDSYELVVVNDGSADATGAEAEAVARDNARVRVEHHPVNRGIGEVYRTGFSAARGTYLTFLPADGQFPATIVPDFVRRMTSADLVLGYIPTLHRPLAGRVLSFGERTLYHLMFGAMPKFQGIMMFRREMLEQLAIQPGGRGWGVLMEIIVKARRAGLRIASAATPLRPRMAGESKVTNVRSVVANLKQAGDLWRRLRRWRPPASARA